MRPMARLQARVQDCARRSFDVPSANLPKSYVTLLPIRSIGFFLAARAAPPPPAAPDSINVPLTLRVQPARSADLPGDLAARLPHPAPRMRVGRRRAAVSPGRFDRRRRGTPAGLPPDLSETAAALAELSRSTYGGSDRTEDHLRAHARPTSSAGWGVDGEVGGSCCCCCEDPSRRST